MARRQRGNEQTYWYDREGRLRAQRGPQGVIRYQWDGQQMVGQSTGGQRGEGEASLLGAHQRRPASERDAINRYCYRLDGRPSSA